MKRQRGNNNQQNTFFDETISKSDGIKNVLDFIESRKSYVASSSTYGNCMNLILLELDLFKRVIYKYLLNN